MNPEEIALFLKFCLQENVGTIVESGRGRWACSTRALRKFGRRYGVGIVSIDWEQRRLNKWISRVRAQRSGVKWLVGDGCVLVPLQVASSPDDTAVLIDGPKHEDALKLLENVWAFNRVKVVALHNADEGTWTGIQFRRLFPNVQYCDRLAVAVR